LEYLHVEGYAGKKGERKMAWMPIQEAFRRDEQVRRETELRRAAERARIVGPPRRRGRRSGTTESRVA
jgi:hypothetical protein